MTTVIESDISQNDNNYVRVLAGGFRLSGPVTFTLVNDQLLSYMMTYKGENNPTAITSNDIIDILRSEGFDGEFRDISQYSKMVSSVYQAMRQIETYCSIEFEEAANPADAYLNIFGVDWLQFNNGNNTATGMGAFPQDYNSKAIMSLDVTYNLASYIKYGYDPEHDTVIDGSGSRTKTALHELLHTIGLAHPHDTGAGTIQNLNQYANNEKYTVMSYVDGYDTWPKVNTYGHAMTPMALDIAALHRLYGAKHKAQADTTYQILDDGEALLDDPENGYVGIGRAYYSIWDTGGIDKIEYNGTSRVLINLNQATLTSTPTSFAIELENIITKTSIWADLPDDVQSQFTNHAAAAGGYVSSTFSNGIFGVGGGMRAGGFTIAHNLKPTIFDAGIEEAKGGSGDDILIGNSLDNLLRGFDGIDFIYGGDGDDMIYGGSGDDILHGGHGNDKIWGGYGDDIIWSGRGDYTEIQGGGGNDIIIAESDWNYVDAGDNDDIVVIKGQGDYLGWGGNDSFDLTHFTPNFSGNNSVNGAINGEYSINNLYTNSISDFSIRNNGGILDIYAKGFHVSNIHNFVVGHGFDLDEFAWGNNLSSNYYNQLDIYTMALTGQIDTGGHSYNSGWDIGTITKAAAYSDKISYANQYIFSFTLPEAAPGMRYISFYNAATAEINGNYYSLPVFTNSITNEFFITPYGALDSFNFDGDTLISGYVTISLVYEDTMEVVSSSSRSFQSVIVDNRPYEWFDDGPSFSSGLPASVHQGDADLFYVNPHPDYSRGSNDDGHWFG